MQKPLGKSFYNPSDRTTPATSSGTTAGATAVTGECVFHGILIQTDGSNDVTFNTYDNTTASGTRILTGDLVVAGNTNKEFVNPPVSLHCSTGIHVTCTCAGTFSWQVFYDDAD